MKHSTRWVLFGAAVGAVWIGVARRRNMGKADHWHRHMKRAAAQTPGGFKALVTGASSGIGEAYARALGERGYSLVLVARREERLRQLAAEYERKFGVQAEVLPADLSTVDGIARVEQRLAAGDIDFLVNNAGYDVFGDFAETNIVEVLGLINCLELSTVRLTRAALPAMLERRRGAVVNVSSIGAFGPKRKDAAYVASKAFVNRFTESLALELKGSGVRVQSLCPGFTLTEFHDAPVYAPYHIKERIPGWMWMKPEKVVTGSLRALGEDRVVYVPGLIYQFAVIAARTGLSQFLMRILAAIVRRRKTTAIPMEAPVGLLACPDCHGVLSLEGSHLHETLVCSRCAKEFPITNGIPRFAEYESLSGLDRRFAVLYDWFSIVYRLFSRAAFAFIGMTEEQARFEILDKLEPRGSVLEVSVGPGVNLPFLREYPEVREIYGLDISNGQLAQCQSYVQKQGWPVHLYQGNAESLPFQDDSFDSVFHFGGINFFGDKQKAITEMVRVAKPGAKILIGDETERGARGYELTLPGFKKSFHEKREPVRPPVELVPQEMEDVVLDESVWKNWFYCLEFRKPGVKSVDDRKAPSPEMMESL